MSRFSAKLTTDGKPAVTRTGYRRTSATVHGWSNGVRVEAMVGADGKDVFRIYLTNGTSSVGERLLGTLNGGDFERNVPATRQIVPD